MFYEHFGLQGLDKRVFLQLIREVFSTSLSRTTDDDDPRNLFQ